MKVIMTGGGTGGHIYPAIAIADEIKRDFRTQRFCLLEQSEVWKRRWFQITDIRSS